MGSTLAVPSLGAALAILAFAWPGRGAASDSGTDPLRGAGGDRTYQLYCATCHGTRGDGQGPTARYLDPKPQDFTRGAYKLRSTPPGSLPNDEDLIRTVRRGVPGTSMPAWGGLLSDADIRAVARHVIGLSMNAQEGAGSPPPAVEVPASAPPSSIESIQRGRSVYLLMMCWKCHGVRGAGDGPDAPTLKDARGLPISARDFNAGLFKGGAAPGDLYRTLATGMDGTPMVAFFGDPELMARSLILFRAGFEAEVTALKGLDDRDRQGLQQFIGGLPAAEAFNQLEDEEQVKLVEAWQWELVHYVRSFSTGGFRMRELLGLGPAPALYGGEP